jgi:nucleotide-binding universal stress UspA family protein
MRTTGTVTRISVKNILFATDFSPAADAALPYVRALAAQYSATVHALHVRSVTPYPMIGPEAYPAVLEAAEEQAKLDVERLDKTFCGLPHKVYVEQGDFWPLMSELIEQVGIDLIVLGTRGRTGVGRAFLGSTAEEILRLAPCPVLTVGPHVSPDTERRLKMKEILFATDFSPESLGALPYAISLAQEHEARLTLLHVVAEPKIGELVQSQTYVESTLRVLRSLLPPGAEIWCEPNCKVERGGAGQKIIETAIARGSDLIVLGVRRAGEHVSVSTHLAGSVAHTVLTQAQCPVLTLRGERPPAAICETGERTSQEWEMLKACSCHDSLALPATN